MLNEPAAGKGVTSDKHQDKLRASREKDRFPTTIAPIANAPKTTKVRLLKNESVLE